MTSVSFVVPVRNEEEHIRACLESLVEQSYPASEYEIIVVDGRSSDRTREIVEEIRRECPQVLCLENPAGIVPTAMNIGIEAARGEVIIRADGHTVYPRDYAANCVKCLEETGADTVGGPCVTVPADESFSARLVAAVLSSPFGVGNSRFRTSREEGFVDTVPFGAFRWEIFDRVGRYNEKLVRNQDNDLNARIRKAGGKIYLTPALTTRYYPAKSFLELLKYAFQTSQWHPFTFRENKESMGLRHLAPAVFLMFLLLLFPASLISGVARSLWIGLMCAYLLAGFFFSLRSKNERQLSVAFVQPFATFCFHVSYGAGTMTGLIYLFREPSTKPLRPGLPIREREDVPSLPLSMVESQTLEESRIREVYARRERSARGLQLYSFLNPAHVLMVQEREIEILSLLSRAGVDSLEEKKILEIGCGTGHLLLAILQWGAPPENVFGIDLVPERVREARKMCPESVHLECGNAANLRFPDASFDLILQSTVFSSILDPSMKQCVAAEMLRVLKPGGLILWYDFFMDNPRNADVRGVRKKEILQLFHSCQIHFQRITLAPPMGRLVGRYSPLLYTLLSKTKFLCTHYLCLIRKK